MQRIHLECLSVWVSRRNSSIVMKQNFSKRAINLRFMHYYVMCMCLKLLFHPKLQERQLNLELNPIPKTLLTWLIWQIHIPCFSFTNHTTATTTTKHVKATPFYSIILRLMAYVTKCKSIFVEFSDSVLANFSRLNSAVPRTKLVKLFSHPRLFYGQL